MTKKKIATSIFLSMCLIFTIVTMNPAYVAASSSDKTLGSCKYEPIEPNGIGSTYVQLERRNSTTLSYRVTATSSEGINCSMSVTIVLQRLENGAWINRGTPINRSVTDTVHLAFADNIDVRAYGSGSYRIAVTFRSVNNGRTHVVGPINSFTVNL